MAQNIIVGNKFDSYDELNHSLESLQSTCFFQLWVRDSKSIQSYKKAHPDRHINENLKYVYLHYCCIHGGKRFESRSTGARRTRTFKDSCTYSIKITLTKDGNHLEVVAMTTDHNHSYDEVSYKSLPKQRKLDGSLEKAASLMLQNGCSKKQLQCHLQMTTGKIITTKDIFNLEQKLVKTNVLEKIVKRENESDDFKSFNKEKIKNISKNKKIKKSNTICEIISSLVSDCPTKNFYKRMSVLKKICNLWANGIEAGVIPLKDKSYFNGNSMTEDLKEIMMVPEQGGLSMVNEHLEGDVWSSKDNDEEEDENFNNNIQALNLSEINFLEKRKRGRPRKDKASTPVIKKLKESTLNESTLPCNTNSPQKLNFTKLLVNPNTTNILLTTASSSLTTSSPNQFNPINSTTTKFLISKNPPSHLANSVYKSISTKPLSPSHTNNVSTTKFPPTSNQSNLIKPLANLTTTKVVIIRSPAIFSNNSFRHTSPVNHS